MSIPSNPMGEGFEKATWKSQPTWKNEFIRLSKDQGKSANLIRDLEDKYAKYINTFDQLREQPKNKKLKDKFNTELQQFRQSIASIENEIRTILSKDSQLHETTKKISVQLTDMNKKAVERDYRLFNLELIQQGISDHSKTTKNSKFDKFIQKIKNYFKPKGEEVIKTGVVWSSDELKTNVESNHVRLAANGDNLTFYKKYGGKNDKSFAESQFDLKVKRNILGKPEYIINISKNDPHSENIQKFANKIKIDQATKENWEISLSEKAFFSTLSQWLKDTSLDVKRDA